MDKKDLLLLCEYAKKCKFIIETGVGKSTIYLSEIALKNNVKFISIEINDKLCNKIDDIEYMNGWSITYRYLIKKDNKNFIETSRLKD